MQVVYEDLRQPLLEDLYRHSVEQARLGPVLEQLDDALGALCEATPKELHAGALLVLRSAAEKHVADAADQHDARRQSVSWCVSALRLAQA